MTEPIGQTIRRARIRRGLTQQQLAERLGITGNAVAFWERGQFTPRRHRVAALAEALGLGVDAICRPEPTTFAERTAHASRNMRASVERE